MEDNYTKAYKEVMEILKFVPQDSVNKIPKTMLEVFKAKMDKDWKFTVNINKSFEEQDLLDETKAIFANIFRDYWATPYQKERIMAKEKYDRQKIEKEKLEKYNPNDLFKKTKTNEEKAEISNLPIEVKKEKFYEKIINFFKKIFIQIRKIDWNLKLMVETHEKKNQPEVRGSSDGIKVYPEMQKFVDENESIGKTSLPENVGDKYVDSQRD